MPTAKLTVQPLSVDRLGDLEMLFGANKTTQGCYCMWFLSPIKDVHSGWGTVNRDRFNTLAAEAREPMGLLAYRAGEPVGWCAAGPRSRYARMLKAPTLRNRDPAEDDTVWLVPCFFVWRDARHTGVTTTLLQAAITFATSRGAPAIEGFPRSGDQRHSAADAFLGVEPLFTSCGFTVVDRPSAARVIMRRDL